MKLHEAVNEFLSAKDAEGARPQTLTLYRYVLGRHIAALGSDRAPTDVVPGDIDAWIVGLRAALAPATVLSHVSIAHVFWNWCVRQRLVAASPATTPIHRPRTPLLANRALDPADLAKMLAYAREHNPRDYAMLLFLADTGCRSGALCGVRLADLDLEKRLALVAEKGGIRSKVYFARATAEALRRWLPARPLADNDRVFITVYGNPFGRASLWNWLHDLARAAGVNGRFNPHAFRHLVGQRFARAGVPLSVIAAKLNHRNPAVTAQLYLNQTEDDLRAATERLSPLQEDS